MIRMRTRRHKRKIILEAVPVKGLKKRKLLIQTQYLNSLDLNTTSSMVLDLNSEGHAVDF
jgi:hypothetical protein